MEESRDNFFLNLLICLCVILIAIMVFFSSYYFFMISSHSLYKNKLKLEVEVINKINKELSRTGKDKTINIKKIKNNIPNIILELQQHKNHILNLKVPNKYINDSKNLLKGLNNNILMYKEILNISNDTPSYQLKNHINLLKKYKYECMNYYALASIKDIHISLDKESLNFLNSFFFYTEKQIRDNINKKIILSQNLEFFNSTKILLDNFKDLKKDYKIYINKARNTKNGYDNLLCKITQVESNVANIKYNLCSLNVPNDATNIQHDFLKLIDNFTLYLQDFKYALKTEQLTYHYKHLNSSSLNNLYLSSQKHINTVNNDYTKLIKSYEIFFSKLKYAK